MHDRRTQIVGLDKKPRCKETTCQCPCYNATAYNYCSGIFAVSKYVSVLIIINYLHNLARFVRYSCCYNL